MRQSPPQPTTLVSTPLEVMGGAPGAMNISTTASQVPSSCLKTMCSGPGFGMGMPCCAAARPARTVTPRVTASASPMSFIEPPSLGISEGTSSLESCPVRAWRASPAPLAKGSARPDAADAHRCGAEGGAGEGHRAALGRPGPAEAPGTAQVRTGGGQRAFVHHVLLPVVLLTVALLGGLRVVAGTGAFLFVAPPLVTLVLAGLLMSLFVRGGLVRPGSWVRGDQPLLANLSHILTLVTLFAASTQAFNSVLPEQGLLHWLFCFFFLWTLWNNQF